MTKKTNSETANKLSINDIPASSIRARFVIPNRNVSFTAVSQKNPISINFSSEPKNNILEGIKDFEDIFTTKADNDCLVHTIELNDKQKEIITKRIESLKTFKKENPDIDIDNEKS